MTNKVKPFYIRIADDMTPQMVQDAFDKCRKLDVKDTELCDSLDYSHWVYFGVCGRDGLYYSDYHDNFHGDAQEITLTQLDEWLGLEVEREWDGESLPPVGTECEILFKEYPHKGFGLFSVLGYHGGVIWVQYTGPLENNGKCYTAECSTLEFRKPETPEQKAEREKKEAIDEIKGTIDFFADSYMAALSLYEQGYHKK